MTLLGFLDPSSGLGLALTPVARLDDQGFLMICTCPVCGVGFTPNSPGKGRPRKFCGRGCAVKAANDNRRYRDPAKADLVARLNALMSEEDD